LKGVILAAGKGSRLYPITYHIPKPILPLANRPTMHYAFDKLKEVGITEICIVVGENEATMRSALGDGSMYGINLSYVRQEEPKGLAHAVSFAKDWVAGDDFALYLGDVIYGGSFVPYVKQFKESGAANVTVLKVVEDPSRYGIAYLEGERIVRTVEKPKNPDTNLALIGFYIFGPQLWDVLPDLQPSARGEYEITDAVELISRAGHDALAGIYEGAWYDTGTLDSFLETTTFLANGSNQILGDVHGTVGKNVVVGEGANVVCASIEDSVILPGANVKTTGHIRHSVVGGETVREGDLIGLRIFGEETLEG